VDNLTIRFQGLSNRETATNKVGFNTDFQVSGAISASVLCVSRAGENFSISGSQSFSDVSVSIPVEGSLRAGNNSAAGRAASRFLIVSSIAEAFGGAARVAFDHPNLIRYGLTYGPNAIVNTPDAICAYGPILR
jgi:hypothetical protein